SPLGKPDGSAPARSAPPSATVRAIVVGTLAPPAPTGEASRSPCCQLRAACREQVVSREMRTSAGGTSAAPCSMGGKERRAGRPHGGEFGRGVRRHGPRAGAVLLLLRPRRRRQGPG